MFYFIPHAEGQSDEPVLSSVYCKHAVLKITASFPFTLRRSVEHVDPAHLGGGDLDVDDDGGEGRLPQL